VLATNEAVADNAALETKFCFVLTTNEAVAENMAVLRMKALATTEPDRERTELPFQTVVVSGT
jgi:hypothetical protein